MRFRTILFGAVGVILSSAIFVLGANYLSGEIKNVPLALGIIGGSYLLLPVTFLLAVEETKNRVKKYFVCLLGTGGFFCFVYLVTKLLISLGHI